MKSFIFALIFACTFSYSYSLEKSADNQDINKLAGKLGFLTDSSFFFKLPPNTEIKSDNHSIFMNQLNPKFIGEHVVQTYNMPQPSLTKNGQFGIIIIN